ncbi:MAG: TauD/TfdA family dioxygenase, partial [Candidatus Competibacteraceae bacterium]|nr:TauD/TfdA family dioxygenase [Candidatus Competibacteraceae bacterium]
MTNLADIPEFLAIPAAWTGAEISQQSAQWRWTLTPAELVELEQAGRRFMADYGTLAQMTAAHFPLPGMQSKLSALRQTLIQGIGFEVIRGLPVERLGTELASTIFCGIGAHLGSTRSQNAQGHLLGHVRDQGANSQDPNIRIYQTNERQTFHTDSADVVALLCLNEARQGGDSLLVSAVT